MSLSQDDLEEGSEIFEQQSPANEVEKPIAARENRQVNVIRWTTGIVLLVSAGVVAWLVFAYGRLNEIDKFEKEFWHQAAKIVDEYQHSANTRMDVIRSFTESITAHGLESGDSWPNVTLPNFEARALTLENAAGVRTLTLHPVVFGGGRERRGYEAYTRENNYWVGIFDDNENPTATAIDQEQSSLPENTRRVQESENTSGGNGNGDPGRWNVVDEQDIFDALANFTAGGEEALDGTRNTPRRIYRLDSLANGATGATTERGAGPFLPNWQMAPVLPIPELVNLNALSLASREMEMTSCMEYGTEVISRVQDYTNTTEGLYRGALMALNVNRYQGIESQLSSWGPVSDLYFPVFDTFESKNRSTAAVLSTVIFWQDYLFNILSEGTTGVVAVLENTCNQTFSFEVNGPIPEYIGEGDLHDPKYDHIMQETSFGSFLGVSPEDYADVKGSCFYNLRLYPSDKLKDTFVTAGPLYFALIMIGVFSFTSLSFILYDFLNQRRHKVVNKTAEETNAVVSNLFPDAVRDRMTSMYTKSKSDAIPDKRPLGQVQNKLMDAVFNTDVPIADLYPRTTVLFTDIAGFTKYSSSRSPTQIFQLLEALYGSFDRLARKHRVFKVETIGDCYVAVTGLPKPQLAHAEIMCRFASACLIELSRIMPVLVEKLGADTAELSMRFGIHSGPVTAGVLRGEKARFQLFGDTVNTAARMESNGQRGRIHVSQATADLLQNAGKVHWLTRREDLIEAKGKGLMQTYWVDTGHSDTVSALGTSYNYHESRSFGSGGTFFSDDADDTGSGQGPTSKDDDDVDMMERLHDRLQRRISPTVLPMAEK